MAIQYCAGPAHEPENTAGVSPARDGEAGGGFALPVAPEHDRASEREKNLPAIPKDPMDWILICAWHQLGCLICPSCSCIRHTRVHFRNRKISEMRQRPWCV